MKLWMILVALVVLIAAAPAFAASPCLPAGAPDFSSWDVTYHRAADVAGDDGSSQALSMVVYTDGTRELVVFRHGFNIVAIDLAPKDEGVPLWIDAGYLTDQKTVRTVPGQACQWKQLSTQES